MESRHLRAVRRSSCFFEDDSTVSVLRRSAAEGIGTFLLMVAVVGSGLQKESSVMSSSIAISGSLIALILAFGAVSGGHFNPTITLVQWRRNQRRLDCTVGYVTAQILGGVAGALASGLLFGVTPGSATFDPPSLSSLASEGIASFGLMTIVFCSTKSTSKFIGPFAVGLWLMAAIVSTPTGSIANPAVAIGLLAAPGNISVFAVVTFIVIQVASGSLAAQMVSLFYPNPRRL
ncbi:aquaporin [Rhizobium sp. 768_B6_N1_8]|uniref:aquaporin n=1 Tax=unclassified Rhizobium TaxID=2613769 RepID=UPI003F28B26D